MAQRGGISDVLVFGAELDPGSLLLLRTRHPYMPSVKSCAKSSDSLRAVIQIQTSWKLGRRRQQDCSAGWDSTDAMRHQGRLCCLRPPGLQSSGLPGCGPSCLRRMPAPGYLWNSMEGFLSCWTKLVLGSWSVSSIMECRVSVQPQRWLHLGQEAH